MEIDHMSKVGGEEASVLAQPWLDEILATCKLNLEILPEQSKKKDYMTSASSDFRAN